MSKSTTYRQISKLDYQHPNFQGRAEDRQIELGALQRIADAVEVIAQDKQDLENALKTAKLNAKTWQEIATAKDRHIAALKGQITKLKKKMKVKS